MWRWGALAAAVAGAGVLVHVAPGGCGSDGSAGTGAGKGDAGSGAGGGGSGNTTSTGTISDAGGGDCPPLAVPAVVPDGWVEFGDWSCDCRFYLPGSAAALPPPIAWEPCPAAPSGIDCRSIAVTWTDASTAVGLKPSFWHGQGGQEVLMYRQIADTYALDLIADIGGSVHFAMITPIPAGKGPGTANGCGAIAEDLDDGRFIFALLGHDANGDFSDSLHEGALAGTVGEIMPYVLQRFEDEQTYSWYISGDLVARGAAPSFEVFAMPWDLSSETLVTSPAVDQEGLRTYQVNTKGQAVFFSTHSSSRDGINVWTAAENSRPFIRFPGDSSRGAGDLGTDGVDLVWTYGEGKAPGDTFYPVRSVMTAPFTTDAAALEPRRLRSQPDKPIGLFPYAAGCGYAAHRGDAKDTLVVRLSDGVSWDVPQLYPSFVPSHPIGLTCEDVIIRGTFGDQVTIARIRLDSLGPGIPPD